MALRDYEHGAPSHLGTVLRAISDLLSEAADPTPLMVGAHYASENARGTGNAPHVILVPEPNGGRCNMGPAYETGRAAGQTHVCDVIVRAAESGDDISRLDAAYALSDRMVAIVRRACVGKVEIKAPVGSYPSPTTADAFGAGLSWSFTYDRDVAHDDAVSRIAASSPDTTPARPHGLPGSTGTLHTLHVSEEVST